MGSGQAASVLGEEGREEMGMGEDVGPDYIGRAGYWVISA